MEAARSEEMEIIEGLDDDQLELFTAALDKNAGRAAERISIPYRDGMIHMHQCSPNHWIRRR